MFAGYDGKVSVTPLRIVLLTGLVTCYAIQCLYNASIIAFLFAPSNYIRSVNDLSKRGYITFTSPESRPYALSLFTVRLSFPVSLLLFPKN